MRTLVAFQHELPRQGTAKDQRQRSHRPRRFCYTWQSASSGKTHQAAPDDSRISTEFGEWLSLVEHLVRDQGVGGSNPLSPTIYLAQLVELSRASGFFHALLSR